MEIRDACVISHRSVAGSGSEIPDFWQDGTLAMWMEDDDVVKIEKKGKEEFGFPTRC